MGVIFVELNGVTYSVIQCSNCDHRTPADQICPMCQPNPTEARCLACYLRGPIPTETITVAPGQVNDAPGTTTIIVTPSGANMPPGHNA